MHSLLIVDDERWVRHGLRYVIDWQAEGIEVVGEAEDGEEALRLIDEACPDIIITDIRMPGIDGLTLIKTIKDRRLNAKVIIVSGYNDFGYAIQALKSGASDYILKPIEETTVLDTVRKCIAELDHEQQNRRRMRESVPLARQRYFETLLTGEGVPPGKRQSVWEALEIGLDPDKITVICIQVHEWGGAAHDAGDRSLLRYALSNIAQELGAGAGRAIAFPLNHHDCTDVVLMLTDDRIEGGMSPVYPIMRDLQDAAERYLGIGLTIGISRERDCDSLPVSFGEAIAAAAHAFYDGYGSIYEASRVPRIHGDMGQPAVYTGPEGWESRFLHAMKAGDETMLRETVEELAAHLHQSRNAFSPLVLRRGLERLFHDADLKLKACRRTASGPSLSIPFCSLSRLQAELMPFLTSSRIGCEGPGNRKRVIELALRYMEQHFAEGVTMNSVAEHLYLNPSYFSKIFHEEMGETFSKYMTRLRIGKAKKLLKESTFRIYEIAEHVGYGDFRHFTKTFKDIEGLTPAQFRDMGVG